MTLAPRNRVPPSGLDAAAATADAPPHEQNGRAVPAVAATLDGRDPVEAEIALLRAAILDPAACVRVLDELRPDDLTHRLRREILRAISAAAGEGAPSLEAVQVELRAALPEIDREDALLHLGDVVRAGLPGVVPDLAPLLAAVKRAAHERATADVRAQLRAAVGPAQDALAERLLALRAAPAPKPRASFALTARELQRRWDEGLVTPRPWFLERIIHRTAVALIQGPTGACKSALLWELGILAASPGEWTVVRWPIVAHPEGRPWRVGVFLGENDTAEFAERLHAILGVGYWPENLLLYDVLAQDEPPNLGTPEGLDWLDAEVEAQRLDVVVLDNIMSLVGGDHVENPLAKLVMGSLRRMGKRRGVTVTAGIHASKGSASGDMRRATEKTFGASYWANWADCILALDFEAGAGGRPNEDSPRRLLRHAKMRGRVQAGRIVELDPDSMRLVDHGEIGRTGSRTYGEDSPRAKVTLLDFREALQPVGAQQSADALCERLGISDRTLRRALNGDRGFLAALGDELQVVDGEGPRDPKAYRLVPLEERVGKATA